MATVCSPYRSKDEETMSIGVARAINLCASIIRGKRTEAGEAKCKNREHSENQNRKLVMNEVEICWEFERRKRYGGWIRASCAIAGVL